MERGRWEGQNCQLKEVQRLEEEEKLWSSIGFVHPAKVKCSEVSYEPTPSVFIPFRLVQVFSEIFSSAASTWTYADVNIRRLDKNKAIQILAVSLSVGLGQSFCQSHKYYAEKKTHNYKLSLCLCEPPLCTSFAVLRTRGRVLERLQLVQ
jgi:hypothetical protein